MKLRRARRIRNVSRYWNGPTHRKVARTKVRYCVLCPVLKAAAR